MDSNLNSRLIENKQKLKKQDNDLNDILKLTENTNQNLIDGKENLMGQQGKIQMGIDNVNPNFITYYTIYLQYIFIINLINKSLYKSLII